MPGAGDAQNPALHRQTAEDQRLDEDLSIPETNLVLKQLQGMEQLPKFELGDAAGRSERFDLWKIVCETLLRTARRVALGWWSWVWAAADSCYAQWLEAPPTQKHLVKMEVTVPRRFEIVEGHFFPRNFSRTCRRTSERV